jgi:hypothetical protein
MHLVRKKTMLASPQRLTRAFEKPELVQSLVDRGAPYKTITAVQKNPSNDSTPGWFRNFWALGSKVIFDGAEEVFHNPVFLEAAKKSFRAEVVKPLAMMTNLNVPAPSSPPHLDLPFFRGAHQREIPSWMLAPMGYSDLFHEWAIPIASAITWFYEGSGGHFEYWPEGLDSPSQSVAPPYSNTAVLADNEYMYHRVDQMGEGQYYLQEGISSEALLHRRSAGWEIMYGDKSLRFYSSEQIRVSILWKAFCFKTQYDADSFEDPGYNLTPEKVVEVFSQDLKKKGVTFQEPSNLDDDRDWMKVILDNYAAPDGAAY